MDVVERLTLEAAQADTMLACEHRHRYEFAATLCAGQRVLDLCCGSGYGSAILAHRAREVVGVDNDAATVELAQVTVGTEFPNVSFAIADAVAYLRGDIGAQFDAVVCFEGLEHLPELELALELLCRHAGEGVRIIASVPNDKLFSQENPYHVTQFGYDEAMKAFASFPSAVMVPQFLAEGSLICPEGAADTEVTVTLEDRDESAYANHFIFGVNFDDDAFQRAHHGRIQVNTSPVFNRWAEDLKRGAWALRRENARLARARLGKAGSAAAAALGSIVEREAQITALTERCRTAELRVTELEAALAGRGPAAPAPLRRLHEPALVPVPHPPRGAETPNEDALDLDEPRDSWENRRRRALGHLIPWIEQSVPLAGKTVLDYRCGDGAVTCAFAERAERVISLAGGVPEIEAARERVGSRGLSNVEFELSPLDSMNESLTERQGMVDMFLLHGVLEHLAVGERLDLLRLARGVVRPEGVIVVSETPNRLTYFDHHTAELPFFNLLPAELAAECYAQSPREGFRAAVGAAKTEGREAALEALVRWGRGVSFHEFEVVFGDLTRYVIASNYDQLLFPERPIQTEEIFLARYLERFRPELAPVWSRSWLDVILSARAISKRPSFLRPWCANTMESAHVGWSSWDNMHLPGPDATLWINCPQPTQRIVVGTVAKDGGWLGLQVRAEASETTLSETASTPARGDTAFTAFELPAPSQRIALSPSGECHVVFVGYDD